MFDTQQKRSLTTQAVHAGELIVPNTSHPLSQPIYQATVYGFDSLEAVDEAMSGATQGYAYYRIATPNQVAFEQAMATLERGETAYASSSGMGAIFASLSAAVQSGDHIIADRRIYGSTYSLLTNQFPRFGVETTFLEIADSDAVRAAVRPTTRLLYFETIGNPLLQVADLEKLAALGHELGLLTFVDSTFTSPALLRPLEWGIDVVLHATTKYIGGHSDALGGIAVGRTSFITSARQTGMVMGLAQGPFDSWLNVRSLKTLPLRMATHSRNALAVARWLEGQSALQQVIYPGLPSHPQHELATRLMPEGCGGMLSFELEGGLPTVRRFIKALKAIPFAPSLADVTTTITHPATTSHRPFSPEERLKLGITEGLLRLSVGIEDVADIIEELDIAFKAL
ncbi:MAG: aminotransferase class I/II-fold pyridoxal phosphate-dependent enzyme [Chloroflexi bacterium]|nr:aminotransferase class I/II-fold pyridoxal phosphate-dependent enzyme [Chloroflexota bacterium]